MIQKKEEWLKIVVCEYRRARSRKDVCGMGTVGSGRFRGLGGTLHMQSAEDCISEMLKIAYAKCGRMHMRSVEECICEMRKNAYAKC